MSHRLGPAALVAAFLAAPLLLAGCGSDPAGSDACTPVAESCNGADDDCDGGVDEDFTDLGTGCSIGLGACQASGSRVCNGAGDGTVCDATAGAPSAELCDGIDNNCDGATDELLVEACYSGPPGTQNVGLCVGGTRSCAGGMWQGCTGELLPTADRCNGLDDDCNPATADGSQDPQVGAACDGADTDVCLEGTWSCALGMLACSDATSSTVDLCNDLDEDCDGTADQDYRAGGSVSLTDLDGTTGLHLGDACGLGRCAGGFVVCDWNTAGVALTCNKWTEMRPELCNGVDDDCEGLVDDNPRLAYCELTLGVCSGSRHTTCGGEAGWLPCVAATYEAHDPAYEVTEALCDDGLDNDCDGLADAADPDCPTTWSHTIAIDGVNDFTAQEQFATTTASYTGWVTWDADYLYVGYQGAEIGLGSPSKWLLVYLGGVGSGTTAGVPYNSQAPILPFPATHHARLKLDQSYFNLRAFDGSGWSDVASTGMTYSLVGAFVELRLPRADLGDPATVRVHASMVNEQAGSEWTFAGLPSSSFPDGDDPDYSHYLEFDFAGGIPPASYLPL